MEKIISILNEIKRMNAAYDISNSETEELLTKIGSAKVCTPIIGKFSSGKSALINTLLGYSNKILKEDITPETAVPAEIVYSNSVDSVTVIRNDGTEENISVNEYRDYKADANTVRYAVIKLRNSFLGKIPDVMLVDMPGFESGFEIHNKAIDNYLPRSLAYIVTFPADDMTVRSSVGNILKELCLHDMPICVVITKYDKKNDGYDAAFENMKQSLKRFIGEKEVHYCETSSFTGDAEELEEFLCDVQEKSQVILSNKFSKSLLPIIENTENYLKAVLNNSNLSESELNEKEEKLQKDIFKLESKFNDEKKEFDLEIADTVDEIKNDIRMAMESEESYFVAIAINGQNINEHLNSTIRYALTTSVKNRIIPKIEKYLKRVENCFKSESIDNIDFSFSFDTGKIEDDIKGVVLAFLVFGWIGAIVAKLIKDKKREEAKQQIRMKLRGEVYPQVLREVGQSVENTIAKQISLINSSIEEGFQNQIDTLNKAMNDIREKINDEKASKESLEIDIKSDLKRIGELKAELK